MKLQTNKQKTKQNKTQKLTFGNKKELKTTTKKKKKTKPSPVASVALYPIKGRVKTTFETNKKKNGICISKYVHF